MEGILHFAYVYELIGWRPRRIDKFTSFPGKFLLTPLTASTGFRDLGQSGRYSGQILQFFRGVETSTRTFAVVIYESDVLPDEAQARSFLATRVGSTDVELCSRVIWLGGDLQSQVEQASQFLRGSRSLQASEFSELGKLRVAADAKGLAIIDTTPSNLPLMERFARVSQLVALSCAYTAELDDLVNSLSAAGLGSGKVAEVALRNWSRFMSAYYFSEPVRQDTIELSRLYNAVKDRQKLTVLAQEATEQLRLLAELVRLDRTEVQAGRERRIQFFLGTMSLLLTVFGLTQLVQVSPKTIIDFRESWSSCVKEFGWQSCVTGVRPAVREVEAVKPVVKRPSSNRAASIRSNQGIN